jgi:anthranilate synthase component 2
LTVPEVEQLAPEGILLSPGPGRPADAGITVAVITELAGRIPIFGVCLGHQAIAEAFGGRVVRAPRLMHGRTSPIVHSGHGVFRGLPNPFTATRYHSLIVDRESLPDMLDVTAWTDHGELMGIRHRTVAVEGVQFHPESFLTEHGHALLQNFLGGLPRGGRA